MARLGMVIDDRQFNGGYMGKEYAEKLQAKLIAQLARKIKTILAHGHGPLEGEEF